MLDDAVAMATDNAHSGQLPFGAFVTDASGVVANGVNTTLRDLDPTAHAEVVAIRAACLTRGSLTLDNAVVYTSCEPCAMCQATAVQVGVVRFIYAAPSELAASLGFPASDAATRMQDAWRIAAPEFCVPGASTDPAAPFLTWTRLHDLGKDL